MSTTDDRLTELERRVESLERDNVQLLRRVSSLESSAKSGEGKPTRVITAPVKGPNELSPTVPVRPPGSLVSEETLHSEKNLPRKDVPSRSKIPKLTDGINAELTELKIGGTLLNRIGIVAFVFGLGFFLKYSFDNNWIGPTGRIIIGILTGVALLGAGEYGQRKKYSIFSQGLTGGGVAALYFSIFAAFSFYHLLGQTAAFGVMILITTTAVLLSVRYDSFATAMLGIVGGFLTPFFLDTGKPNEIGLFSYIALLDCGILALAAYKNWRIINIISFVFTFGISALWASSPNSAGPVWTNEVFYTIFFVIFALVAVFYNVVNRVQTKNDDLILIIFNAAGYFALSFINLSPYYHGYMGFLPLTMALFYFVLGYSAWMRNKEDRFLVISLWGLSIVFLTITMPVQLDGKWITAAWAVEAVVLFWLGIFNKSYIVRMSSFGILGIALLSLPGDSAVFTYWYDGEKRFWPVLNLNMLPFLACIAAAFIISRLYYRNSERITPRENMYWIWLTVLGVILTGIWSTLEITYFCESWGQKIFGRAFPVEEIKIYSYAVIWFIESVVLTWLGARNRRFDPQVAGIICFGIGILLLIGPAASFYFFSDSKYWPLLNIRAIPYLAGIVSSLYISKKVVGKEGVAEAVIKILTVGAAVTANLIAMTYLSLEVYGFYDKWGSAIGLYNDIDKAVQMTLSVVWTLYAIGLMVFGFIWKRSPLRYMAIIIFAVTILKVFLFDLANLDTIYRIVSFIVLGGLLVVVSFLYQRYRSRIMGDVSSDDQKGVEG